MKKCPFCHAQIEDNARFCLYCMSSLDQKHSAEPLQKIKKGWLILIAAPLVLCIIVLCVVLSIDKLPETLSSSQIPQSEIASQSEAQIELENSSDVKTSSLKNSSIGMQTSSHPQNVSTSSSSSHTDNTTSYENSQQVNLSSQTSYSSREDKTSTSTSTPTSTSTSKAPQITTTTSHKQDDTTSVSSSKETETQVEYIYKKPESIEEVYPSHWIPVSYNLENYCVITGIKTPQSNGIYHIPDEIDGLKVMAVMPSAFCADGVAETVKYVVISKNIKSIWDGAFTNCVNLSDIYIIPKTIEISPNAFAPINKRKANLTFFCDDTCKNYNFEAYKTYIENFGATHQTWQENWSVPYEN